MIRKDVRETYWPAYSFVLLAAACGPAVAKDVIDLTLPSWSTVVARQPVCWKIGCVSTPNSSTRATIAWIEPEGRRHLEAAGQAHHHVVVTSRSMIPNWSALVRSMSMANSSAILATAQQ
jgi:hypothetical protein